LELFNFSLVIYVGGCSAFALARQLLMPSNGHKCATAFDKTHPAC
jgi:hypothetical protein